MNQLRCRNALFFGIVVATSLMGCGDSSIETSYGRSRGVSVNGIGTFMELLRQRGHPTKPALRLTPELEVWADVLVRFTPDTGGLRNMEAAWYSRWLQGRPGRLLVYVLNDYSAEVDYWDELLKTTLTVTDHQRATTKRNLASSKPKIRPFSTKAKAKPKNPWDEVDDGPADPAVWFEAVEGNGPGTAKTLEAPWSEGVDASKAAIYLSRHFKIPDENPPEILLEADGKALAIAWSLHQGGQVLVIANGSFLLNGTLLNKARRPLTERVLDWIDERGTNTKIASVEGFYVSEQEPPQRGLYDLAQTPPFDWILAHMLVLTLLGAFALAPRLGRARDPISTRDADRPAAHPEALGSLMKRSVPPEQAREILATYRLWRSAAPRSRRPRRTSM